jgi:guanosine-3',5'-bis(diphosphate) 3'-pyrophosphohydrolase
MRDGTTNTRTIEGSTIMNIGRDLLQAVNFAADKHRDQRRKNVEASPYINHPIQVAELIARIGEVDDLVVLMAAVLHDTVEDTETSLNELENVFGLEVSDLVAEVTDDKSLSKAQRKKEQVKHTATMTDRAKLIKLADKTCNIRDVAHSPPQDWDLQRRKEYLDWASEVIDGCRGTNAHLERYFDESMQRATEVLGL